MTEGKLISLNFLSKGWGEIKGNVEQNSIWNSFKIKTVSTIISTEKDIKIKFPDVGFKHLRKCNVISLTH